MSATLDHGCTSTTPAAEIIKGSFPGSKPTSIGSDRSTSASSGSSSASSSALEPHKISPFGYLVSKSAEEHSTGQPLSLQTADYALATSAHDTVPGMDQVDSASPLSTLSPQSERTIEDSIRHTDSDKELDIPDVHIPASQLHQNTPPPIPFLIEARNEHVFQSPIPLRRHHSSFTAGYEPTPLPLYSSNPSLPSLRLDPATAQTSGYTRHHYQWTMMGQRSFSQHQVPSQNQRRQYQSDGSISGTKDARLPGSGFYAYSHGSTSPSSALSCSSSRSEPVEQQHLLESDGFENLADALANQDGGPAPLYRRFQILNHRVLLHLQDEISKMERVLYERDETIRKLSTHLNQTETSSSTVEMQQHLRDRIDHVPETYQPAESPVQSLSTQVEFRTQLLGRIFIKLGQYNQALATYSAAAGQFSRAEQSEISTFREWVSTNAINQDPERMAFLKQELDLISLDRPIQKRPVRPRPKLSPTWPVKDSSASNVTRNLELKRKGSTRKEGGRSAPSKWDMYKSWAPFLISNVLLILVQLILSMLLASSFSVGMETKLYQIQMLFGAVFLVELLFLCWKGEFAFGS